MLIFVYITTKFNAHGLPHEPSKLAFLKDIPVYNYVLAPELSSVFKSVLAAYTEDLLIKIIVLNSKDTFGVINRQVEVNGKKRYC
ncbi:MAG: hypothetical protein ABJH82_00935 [Polaribacter sp.]|uniref:hypothetical protein n=1 Tax=Polaribacter sp. TaxID=1920175 RepID=UPI003265F638